MKEYRNIEKEVDHFFRREYGKIVSILTTKFGTQYLDNIEDAVQESMVKALKTWPFSGKPQNPTSWFLRVANNALIDQTRKSKVREKYLQPARSEFMPGENDFMDKEKFGGEDLLPMIFSCCHPELPQESQLVLALKILCGLGIKEIAQALFKTEAAISKSYTRSKSRFKALNPKLELPSEREMEKRLDSVLKVIYLLYNEGYKPTQGSQVINKDICDEAIHLGKLLEASELSENPMIHALIALMLFQTARFSTRMGENGELIPMKDQDRSKWDQGLILNGVYHLNKSADSKHPSDYHILAGIAYNHCIAPDYESTDWKQILKLYDIQIAINPTPISNLNRVVAVAKVYGAQRGLEDLAKLHETFKDYYLMHAIRGELLFESGRNEDAIDALLEAIKTVKNNSEKIFIEKKLSELNKKE